MSDHQTRQPESLVFDFARVVVRRVFGHLAFDGGGQLLGARHHIH